MLSKNAKNTMEKITNEKVFNRIKEKRQLYGKATLPEGIDLLAIYIIYTTRKPTKTHN